MSRRELFAGVRSAYRYVAGSRRARLYACPLLPSNSFPCLRPPIKPISNNDRVFPILLAVRSTKLSYEPRVSNEARITDPAWRMNFEIENCDTVRPNDHSFIRVDYFPSKVERMWTKNWEIAKTIRGNWKIAWTEKSCELNCRRNLKSIVERFIFVS